jgi:hypothetical protein
MRTIPDAGHSLSAGSQTGDLRFQTKSFRTCQGLRPHRTVRALAMPHPFVLPSANINASASWMRKLSRLNGGLHAPLSTLRRTSHGILHMTQGR